MADNIAITAGTGTSVAADDISSVFYQRIKVSLGADGSATDMLGGAGAVAAGVQRITLASDDPAVAHLNTLVGTSPALGAAAPANSVPVVAASGSTATVTSVNSSASSAQMLAATSARRAVIFKNTDEYVCYIKFGTTASATDFSIDLQPNELVTIDGLYTGRIDALWATDGTGALKITEIT